MSSSERPIPVNDEITAATETLKAAEDAHARAQRGAQEQPDVREANGRWQAARTRWRTAQLRKRHTDIADAERRAVSMVADLAAVEAAIGAAESQLTALRAQHLSGLRDLDALRRWIADATPKPRRRAIVTISDDLDPLVPPEPLALLAVDQWQALFAEAHRRKSANVTVLFDEINGWLLDPVPPGGHGTAATE